jgi:hypothetical protein
MLALLRGAVIVALAIAAAGVSAADLGYVGRAGVCVLRTDSQLMSLPPEEIHRTVTEYFENSKLAMSEPVIIESRKPAFTWAFEARISCGKAIGYIKGGHFDEESIEKCDCYYQRFISFW